MVQNVVIIITIILFINFFLTLTIIIITSIFIPGAFAIMQRCDSYGTLMAMISGAPVLRTLFTHCHGCLAAIHS